MCGQADNTRMFLSISPKENVASWYKDPLGDQVAHLGESLSLIQPAVLSWYDRGTTTN